MDATTTKRSPGDSLKRFLGTRRGALTVALLAAAFAAIALIAYLNDYKDDVRGGAIPTPVLIADRLIPKGTAGDVVASDRLFKPSTIAEDAVKTSAVADASSLEGKVATRDIFPGEQLTSDAFGGKSDELRGRLIGTQRAIGVPVDEAHGLLGSTRAGDRVDIFASFGAGGTGASRGVLRTLATDVLVLKAPEKADDGGSGGDEKTVLLRLTDQQAAKLAFASDNGTIWFALRPPVGGRSSGGATVTLGSVAGSGSSSGDSGTAPGGSASASPNASPQR